ncbi:MAG TPA: ATP-binding protein [Kofleriaceae bacterium]|nr:ATP-binding protein [Kofleriaceae bacterium]
MKLVDKALVPQADDLARIRHAVAAVASGATSLEQVGRKIARSARHAAYAVAAARTLGWLSPKQPLHITRQGADLLETEPGSREEADVMRLAVQTSPTVKAISPALLADRPPSQRQLTGIIEKRTGLARSTASRRATTLLAWRGQLVDGVSNDPTLPAPEAASRLAAPAPGSASGSAVAFAPVLLPPLRLSDALARDLFRDNPWWRGEPAKQLPPTRRTFVNAIHKRLEYRLAPIIVVRGPRQVGKTTAQLQVIDDLLRQGIPATRILRVQCDELPEITNLSEPILRIVEWYEQTILGATLNRIAADGGKTYLLFDEVQNLEDWATQLKHLVDNTTTQVVVTGSSALRIEAGRDSLAGRINTIEVGTLTLREIAAIRHGENLSTALTDNGLESLISADFWRSVRDLGETQREVRDRAFAAFAERGGYPLVHDQPGVPWPQVADQLNENIIRRVIQHDLRVGDRGRKRDAALLEEIFRLACRYAGQAPSLETFAREAQRALTANVGTQRVRQYLDFLDRTLLLRLVRPLEIRLKRTRGFPKLCLADHGLRASWLQELVPLTPEGLARDPQLTDLAGRLAESIVGAYLLTIGGLDLSHFPERPGEPEVDFILTIGSRRIPVEVKYRRRIDPWMDTEGLRSFIEKTVYNAPFGLLITQGSSSAVQDPRIIELPMSSLLLLR